MGLRTKFSLVLFLVFGTGIAVTGYLSNRLLQQHARDEVLQNAGVMMAAAMAVRGYTVDQVRPHLNKLIKKEFLPQTVPAYAATEVFGALRQKYPDYAYKEATINPTNPRDRATDWETDIVNIFILNPDKTEVVGERDTATGRSLYLARPIKIQSAACLTCHTTPDMAPPSMVAQYGEAHGFGWKMNEIIGAQVVSVPMQVAIDKAQTAFFTFMGSLLAVFVAAFLVLNVMLSSIVVRPIRKMAHAAEEISTGKMDAPEFTPRGNDEVAKLGHSFNRMRRSLEKAMKMLEG